MKKVSALHSWVDNLPTDVRDAVLQRMRPRHYGDGEAVYTQGEQGRELYRVASGLIRFCHFTLSGKEFQSAVFRPGDCFGELSMIDGLYRANSAYAQGPAELLILQEHDFKALYAAHPEIAVQINRLLSHRLRMAYSFIEDASLLAIRDRLVRLLTRLGYSVGKADAQGATVLKGFTHENLARMLGTTREGISRELKLLEDLALIRRNYGRIVIPDIQALLEHCDVLGVGEIIVPYYEE
ncbi:hypothetical protein GCM10011348_39810 [Marinobacterium nitratireducens]|uniref:Crp/Fnr family transcriptional regulator n=1 Tax=Marinobacterium nitratireducens TaxID=518897 RepID=A0A917ZQ91_9GAMM|nr:Crp/Fnr family transcriptional regulator [Marinobacterium nitratireducens]GGO87193.1 hypothetical protein GCM10011348_39810 [Marinobacterium nitratireducens]